MELYREHPDLPQTELVKRTAKDMAMPCLYTNLTSIIGFLSLVTSNIKPIIDFGWMMALSLVIVFVVLFTFIPAVMMLMEKKFGVKITVKSKLRILWECLVNGIMRKNSS